jgi:putative FmdB family regulatory protein
MAAVSSLRAANSALITDPRRAMPIYNYRCEKCGVFDQMRRVAARDDPARCPQCGASSARSPNGLPMLLTRDNPASTEIEGAYLGRHAKSCLCCV